MVLSFFQRRVTSHAAKSSRLVPFGHSLQRRCTDLVRARACWVSCLHSLGFSGHVSAFSTHGAIPRKRGGFFVSRRCRLPRVGRLTLRDVSTVWRIVGPAESIAVAASSVLSTFSATHLSRLLLSFALVGLPCESLFVHAAPHIVRLSSRTASAPTGVLLELRCSALLPSSRPTVLGLCLIRL